MKSFNVYYWRARLLPTVLTAIPMFLFYWFYIKPKIPFDIFEIVYLNFFGHMSVNAALVFVLIQINRFVAKEVFQKFYFKDYLKMPTTELLLFSSSTITKEMKESVREKIKKDFNINLYTEEKEKNYPSEARKQISLAVSQIRILLRGNKALYQHNIEYGFVRNLLGGCLIALVVSVIGLFLALFYGDRVDIPQYFLIFAIVYSVPIIFSRLLVKKYGMYYANILYSEYLSIEKK